MLPQARDIIDAHSQISHLIHHTPVLTSQALDDSSGAEIYFKCENFQKTGSFKPRGAMYSLLSLPSKDANRPVITHSSGNHGQALAWAAAQQKRPAHIIMPENAPRCKVDAVKGWGGEVISCESTLEARERSLLEVQEKTDGIFIPPYDAYPTMAGQATCAKELLEYQPFLQAIVAPVGGGGLLAGTCLSARYFSQGLAVYGAEPSGADDAFRSLSSGHRIAEHVPNTIADGLRTTLGEKTFPVILKRAAGILCCEDDEIIAAMRLIWERLKVVVEPSAAVGLACVLKRPELFAGKKVGIILSGGNLDLDDLPF